MAVQSKPWVCGCSVSGFTVSNLAGGVYVCLCECYVLSGRGLRVGLTPPFQRNPTECVCVCVCVCVCDLEALIMRRPWPTRFCCAVGKTFLIEAGSNVWGEVPTPFLPRGFPWLNGLLYENRIFRDVSAYRLIELHWRFGWMWCISWSRR